MRKVLVALLLLSASWTSASASPEPNHVYPVYGQNIFGVDQENTLQPGETSLDYTGFAFTFNSGSQYTYNGPFLDEGVDLYFASPGQLFTQSNIDAGQFTFLSWGSKYTLPSTFYLGIRTPSSSYVDNGTSHFSPAYGWVELSSFHGALSVVDSAMDYTEVGVQVGSLAAVPEPSTAGLLFGVFGLAIPLLLARRMVGDRG